MKARIKGFDEPFREIETLTMKGVNGTFYVDDVEFEQQQETIVNHWQDVRERAVIAALQGFTSTSYDTKRIVEQSIEIADALVEKLKGE